MTTTSPTIPRKGGRGGDPVVEDGNDKDNNDDDENVDEEDVMDMIGVLPTLVARRFERLKCLNMERERVMGRYLEERAALDIKYLYLCKPLYKERGNVVAGRLDDEIKRIHKEGGGERGTQFICSIFVLVLDLFQIILQLML